jgi:hypothetical protein
MGQILQSRADAHAMSECSDREEAPPVVTRIPVHAVEQLRTPEEAPDGKR